MHIIGIDGGGTSTTALIADETGRMIGRGIGGPGNYATNGISNVITSCIEAIQGCLPEGITLDELLRERTILVAGISGVNLLSEAEQLAKAFQQKGFTESLISHDGTIALSGALSGKDGVIVISGTGSIAYGLRENRTIQVGGWGYLIDDEGSAFKIALRMIQAVFLGCDGRGLRSKALEEAVLAYFSATTIREILPMIYRNPLERDFIGRLTPLGADLARTGDPICEKIFADAGRSLGSLAVAAIEALGLSSMEGRIGLCGGVFSAGDIITLPMQAEIDKVAPLQTIALPDFEPVMGALLRGYAHIGIPFESVRDMLTKTEVKR